MNNNTRIMSDAKLSRRLGLYQVIERIGTLIGIALCAAGGVMSIVRHNLWLFAGLFFAGAAVIAVICGIVNVRKNALLNSQLGGFLHSELERVFGPMLDERTLPINEAYLKSAHIVSAPWEECEIANYYEAEHCGLHFSVANAALDHSVEEKSGPNNDNWMTKTVTVFKGIIIRCADICAARPDIRINDLMQEKPPKGDVADASVFAERFSACTPGGQDAAALVTPELRRLCSELEEMTAGKLCCLAMRSGELELAIHTSYEFSNVSPNIDLRDIDAVRRELTASIEKMSNILDAVCANF